MAKECVVYTRVFDTIYYRMLVKKKRPSLILSFTHLLFLLFGLLLPSQLSKHFWPDFAYIYGVRIDYLSPTIFLTDFVLIILAFIALTHQKIYLKNFFKTYKVPLIITVGVIIYFFLAHNKFLFLYRVWQYSKILLAAFVLYWATKEYKRFFLYGLIGSSLYVLVLAILQITQQGSLQGGWWLLGERLFNITTPDISTVSFSGQKIMRPYATFSHPNSLAAFYLLVFWIIALSGMTLWATPAFILVILSFSKISIIAMVITWVVWNIKKKKNCVPCAVSHLLLGMWLLYVSTQWKGDPSSMAKRISSWQYAFNVLLTHPFGVGLGNYVNSFIQASSHHLQLQPVHNVFLLFLLEMGAAGIALCFWLAKKVFQKITQKSELFFILFPLIFTGLFDHHWLSLQQNLLLLGVAVGFIFSPSRRQSLE